MKFSIKAMYITALSILALCSNYVYGQKRILNLNDIKWPPFFFPQLESSNTGIAKDILNQCISKDYALHYKALPIKRTHVYMQSGELDVSVYSYKKSREEFIVYGNEPIFEIQYGFASKAADNITINSLNDIYKYRFGHLAGLAHTPKLMKIIEDKKITDDVSESYDLDAMFGQLLASPQRFQVMANSKETFRWRAQQLNITNKIHIHDYTVSVKPYYVTVSKFSKNIQNIDKFLQKIDQCIIVMKTNGQYEKITSSYGLPPR